MFFYELTLSNSISRASSTDEAPIISISSRLDRFFVLLFGIMAFVNPSFAPSLILASACRLKRLIFLQPLPYVF